MKYQTFDEYKLEGVSTIKIKKPYVFVKKTIDTIFVIKSNNSKDTIKYIKKGSYWYCKLEIKEKRTLLDKLFNNKMYKFLKITEFCEKFIYCDTVIEYTYRENVKSEIIDNAIYVNTKQNCIELAVQKDDFKNQKNLYDGLKEFILYYKTIFPFYSTLPEYQPRWRNLFEKKIEGNTLFIYKINIKNEKELFLSKKINSLGEFDNNGMLAWWF